MGGWLEDDIPIGEAFGIMGKWILNNTKMLIIVFSILLFVGGIVAFFVLVFEPPLKEGWVVERINDGKHIAFYEDRKSITRTETYVTTDSEGHAKIKTRQVHDYYMYCIDEHFDGEDFIIQIEAMSEKRQGKIRSRYIYLSEELYGTQELKDYFVADFKERNDTTRDKNNTIKRVTEWSRSHPDMSPWLEKQY